MGPPTKGTKDYDTYLLRQRLRKRATTKTKKRIAAEKLAKGLVLAERQRFKQELSIYIPNASRESEDRSLRTSGENWSRDPELLEEWLYIFPDF